MITISYLHMMHKLPAAPMAVFCIVALYYSDCRQPCNQFVSLTGEGRGDILASLVSLSLFSFLPASSNLKWDEFWLAQLLNRRKYEFPINFPPCQNSAANRCNVSAGSLSFRRESLATSDYYFHIRKVKIIRE